MRRKVIVMAFCVESVRDRLRRRRVYAPLWVAIVGAVALLAGFLAPIQAARAASGGCSPGHATPGGDWPVYGHDLSNSRTQPAETSLSAVQAATLSPVWRYDTTHASTVAPLVDLNTTPIVADGCVFFVDETGTAAALNADTGALVWQHQFAVSGQNSGAISGSPVIRGNQVIFAINQLGAPYLVALDISTGEQRWTSAALTTADGTYTNSSPTIWNGVIAIGFSGPEGVPSAEGGFALVNADNGATLAQTYTIPPTDWAQGYGGGGIWSTAAIDPATGYAYYGTGNPYSKQTEHPRTNAIIKIDLDQTRPTFGQIVASYKGNIDQSIQLIKEASEPTCQLLPENPTPELPIPSSVLDVNQLKDSYGCFQFDLDFGASPNLFTGPQGTLVGELQKSGVYHVVTAGTLGEVHQTNLGVSCLVCNAASTAYDSTTGATIADVWPGSSMTAFTPTTGAVRWLTPVGDATHYQPVAVADGVSYTIDSSGFLDAYDEATGVPILHRSLATDGATGAMAGLASSGVSIANHTVYAMAGSDVIAYRPSQLPIP